MEKKNPVFLSFHILDSSGGMLQFDNARFAFSEPLRPQQQQRVVVVLDNAVLKLRPGNYIAEFDLVREESFWFQEREGMSLRAGAAKAVITPHVGCWMDGNVREEGSKGVHDQR